MSTGSVSTGSVAGFSEMVAIGRYRDVLERDRDGRWRFRRRIVEVEDR